MKTTITAAVAATALAVFAGTAHADPVGTTPLVSGTQDGVEFDTVVEGESVVTVLDAGSFVVEASSETVSVVDAEGATVASLPLTYAVGNQTLSLAPLIGQGGSVLTLTPEVEPPTTAAALSLTDISSQQAFIDQLNYASFGAGTGAVIGGAIGLALGCVIGVVVGCIPGILVGAGAGAVIGAIQAGGQPLIDAGYRYFTGQP